MLFLFSPKPFYDCSEMIIFMFIINYKSSYILVHMLTMFLKTQVFPRPGFKETECLDFCSIPAPNTPKPSNPYHYILVRV